MKADNRPDMYRSLTSKVYRIPVVLSYCSRLKQCYKMNDKVINSRNFVGFFGLKRIEFLNERNKPYL